MSRAIAESYLTIACHILISCENGLGSVTASNLDQSIAGDIVEICGYWRTMTSRSFRVGRSVTGLGLFAIKLIKRGAYIATYRGRRITTEEADRRAAQAICSS